MLAVWPCGRYAVCPGQPGALPLRGCTGDICALHGLVLPQPRFPEVRRSGCGDGCGERSGQSVAAAVGGCLSPRSGDWDARTAISEEAAVRAAVSLIARHGCRRAERARDPGSAISAANGWPWSLCAAPPPHRTDCCLPIRRRGGVKGRFACTFTSHFDVCLLSCGQIGP